MTISDNNKFLSTRQFYAEILIAISKKITPMIRICLSPLGQVLKPSFASLNSLLRGALSTAKFVSQLTTLNHAEFKYICFGWLNNG